MSHTGFHLTRLRTFLTGLIKLTNYFFVCKVWKEREREKYKEIKHISVVPLRFNTLFGLFLLIISYLYKPGFSSLLSSLPPSLPACLSVCLSFTPSHCLSPCFTLSLSLSQLQCSLCLAPAFVALSSLSAPSEAHAAF